jgi:hypothetical protein
MILPVIATLIVVAVSYYIYARLAGLTWTDIKAGHFMSPPAVKPTPSMCKWGAWLPCNDGQQTRYETFASEDEAAETAFECGEKVRKMEQRASTCNEVCGANYAPVCACTEYDMNGVCQIHTTFSNPCRLGLDTSPFVNGMCESKT